MYIYIYIYISSVILDLLQEIPENGADVAHLSQVHGPIMTAGIDLHDMYSWWWSFARHEWAGEWSSDPDVDKHIGTLKLHHSIKIGGYNFRMLDMNVVARQVHAHRARRFWIVSPVWTKLSRRTAERLLFYHWQATTPCDVSFRHCFRELNSNFSKEFGVPLKINISKFASILFSNSSQLFGNTNEICNSYYCSISHKARSQIKCSQAQ